MKYEFKETSLDNYELHYIDKNGKEKVIPFKRTVKLASRIQSAEADARFKMMEYLVSKGKTKDDYIIEKKVDGKIIRDESLYREFEASFIDNERLNLSMELYRELFNMGADELLIDMGINESNMKELEAFSTELRSILIDGKTKTPSIQKISE